MDHEPLVNEDIEAGKTFLTEFAKSFPVRVAFWLRQQDKRSWHLYIVSDALNGENFDMAYDEVTRLVNLWRDPVIDQLKVRPLGADKPVAKAVLAIQGLYRSGVPIRKYDVYLDGVMADELYIYPSPVTV